MSEIAAKGRMRAAVEAGVVAQVSGMARRRRRAVWIQRRAAVLGIQWKGRAVVGSAG